MTARPIAHLNTIAQGGSSVSKPITTLDRRCGKQIIRLMYGQHHRATLLKLTNNRWGIYDTQERRLTKLDFQQPSMARDKFDELYPDGVPA